MLVLNFEFRPDVYHRGVASCPTMFRPFGIDDPVTAVVSFHQIHVLVLSIHWTKLIKLSAAACSRLASWKVACGILCRLTTVAPSATSQPSNLASPKPNSMIAGKLVYIAATTHSRLLSPGFNLVIGVQLERSSDHTGLVSPIVTCGLLHWFCFALALVVYGQCCITDHDAKHLLFGMKILVSGTLADRC
ncbi:hypothetical protein C8J56DRAFT_1170715 [Mycena floridula]|nr:hypothetical protein C8J56DRAFT_1170715 [Mycena floridula]